MCRMNYAEEYFQHEVAYNIEVALNDTDRTLTANETIIYKNNMNNSQNSRQDITIKKTKTAP